MKAFFLALVLGALAGWMGAHGLWRYPRDSEVEPQRAATRSLLPVSRGSEEALSMPDLPDLQGSEGMETFLVRLAQASSSDLKRWLLELQGERNPGRLKYKLSALVVGKWAGIDPAEALAFTEQEGMGFASLILQEWVKVDREAAIAAAFKLDPDGNQVASMLRDSELELRRTLYEHLMASGFDRDFPGAYANMLVAVYDLDPIQAATSALDRAIDRSGQNPFGRTGGLDRIMEKWVKDDRESALEWAQNQEDRMARRTAMMKVASAWIKEDSVEGMERCWNELDHEQKSWLVNVFDDFVPEDVGALFSWVDTHVKSPDFHGKILQNMIQGLRRSDEPEKIAELLPYVNTDLLRVERAVGYAARKWAEKDADGLKQWAETLENDGLRAAAMRAWLGTAEPLEALEHLKSLWDESSRSAWRSRDLLESVIGKLLGDAEVSISEVFENLPAEIRDAAALGYATSQGQQHPRATIAFLEEQPEGNARNWALQYTVGHWAAADPVKASEWVSTLEESRHKEFLSQNLVNNWARQDLEGAATWVEQQPRSASRDQALTKIAEAAQSHYPERAVAWAQSIGDEKLRHEWVANSLRGYTYENPDRAGELLKESGLPDEAATNIEAEIEQARALRALGGAKTDDEG